jgi:N-acetylglucosaminyldiphosphoundecaprenol N-acetyl-beta-D-mannosaminyltransferase
MDMIKHRIFGVQVADATMSDAIELLRTAISAPTGRSTTVFFVNTHTLNLAMSDKAYRDVLNSADCVFGDGTGVRWAMRAISGVQLKDNVNGTDLTPKFLMATADCGYKCFLLGATSCDIRRAAEYVHKHYAGWTVAGYHDGYFSRTEETEVIRQINESGAQLLLVGMGNPLQEEFIARNKDRLTVPLAAGTGGLFTYWAGSLKRAPLWLRRLGAEWVHILLSQPHKWRRYLIGNAAFIYYITIQVIKGKLREVK